MRISVLAGDPDCIRNPRDYKVTLDGIPLTNCLVADSDKGEALCYKLNRFGVLVPNRQGELETVTLRGTVVITKREKAS